MGGIKELGQVLFWESFYRYLLLSKTEMLIDAETVGLLPQIGAWCLKIECIDVLGFV